MLLRNEVLFAQTVRRSDIQVRKTYLETNMNSETIVRTNAGNPTKNTMKNLTFSFCPEDYYLS